MQRPGDAADDPGERVAVPDEAARRRGRCGGVPAGARRAGARLAGARRRGATAEPAVPQPAGVRGRPYLLGGLDSAEKDARRATAVWTTWLPVAETPQTRADAVEDALLGMDALATASPDELRDGLGPLVDGYADWLDGEKGQAEPLRSFPSTCGTLAEEVVEEARAARQRLADGLDHVVADPEALRVLPVHERGDARPAHPHRRSRRSAARIPTSLSIEAARDAGGRGGGEARVVVAAVPAGVHPHAAAGADRPGRGDTQR